MAETLELLTVEEAAQLLKLTPYTIRRLLNEGKLPGRKIGGGRQWRINKRDLEHYSGQGNDKETPEVSRHRSLPGSNAHAMSVMSEAALARDWLKPEEDEAWAHL